MSEHTIALDVNGTPHRNSVSSRKLLVHFLRDDMCLTSVQTVQHPSHLEKSLA